MSSVWDAPIRALVLDIDDTLVDTQAAMRAAGARAAAVALPTLDAVTHQAISDTYYDDHGGHFDAYTRGELSFVDQRRLRFEGSLRHLQLPDEHLGVLMPFQFRTAAGMLNLVSTTTVFGSPVDVTLQELALETFFPADDASAAALRALAQG